MTRKIRRLIFYLFLIIFIVCAFAIILFVEGYSFDWQKKSLIITGAYYLKSDPDDADIYIDNEYGGKTNKFIRRLLPGEHNIKISKPNYSDWQKTLKIKPKVITEAYNIILIKKNPPLNLATDNNIKYLSFSSDKRKIIYLTEQPQLTLRLIDINNNTDVQIYPGALVKNVGYTTSLPSLNNLSGIIWSHNQERIILSFQNNHYYILNLKNPVGIIDINNLIKTLSNYKIYNLENPSFHPQNFNKVYFYYQNNLDSLEINDLNPNKSLISFPFISDVLTYTIYDNKILYINIKGEFYKTNLEASSFKKIFDIPLFKPGQSIAIINEDMLAINKNFYLFNPQTQIFEKIAENIEEVIFSADNKKVFWRNKNEIGIIWLETEPKQPPRNRYETEVIMKTIKNISQAIWYSKTNQHIIFIVENEIKITELDGRDRRNTTDVFTIKNPKIFFNEENGKIHILSEEKLYWIEIK